MVPQGERCTQWRLKIGSGSASICRDSKRLLVVEFFFETSPGSLSSGGYPTADHSMAQVKLPDQIGRRNAARTLCSPRIHTIYAQGGGASVRAGMIGSPAILTDLTVACHSRICLQSGIFETRPTSHQRPTARWFARGSKNVLKLQDRAYSGLENHLTYPNGNFTLRQEIV